MEFESIISPVGALVDLAGVAVIIVGILIASGQFLLAAFRTRDFSGIYRDYRRGLGRALLLGLELLVAADIIRTVAVTPTLESVLVLAGIVLIRTFLSWSLEVEVNGRFPWQHATAERTDQI